MILVENILLDMNQYETYANYLGDFITSAVENVEDPSVQHITKARSWF